MVVERPRQIVRGGKYAERDSVGEERKWTMTSHNCYMRGIVNAKCSHQPARLASMLAAAGLSG